MKITSIHTGYIKLDGGAMFGVVPKRMWQAMTPPDSQNMCTWAMRALLVETGSRKILIDTGIGNKQDARFRAHFEPHGEESLFGSLHKAGLDRSDITDVLLTHLHFDHCGGALWNNPDSGSIEPAFPNAVYWTNERHYQWAIRPNPREKASFLAENFVPLWEAGILQFIDIRQNIEFVPGFNIRFLYGHTEAMMAPVIHAGPHAVVYCADLIPSRWHIGLPYVMAYDIRPLQTMEERAALLEEAVREKYILFFEHDPAEEAGRVRADLQTERIVLESSGPLSSFLPVV
ncbi:MAG: MBL fold metallo-hydrolase [Saprospirales bacterium]|jgi:glyoxylase-like metal-dependent hydrolase (beta-lactamase superfamily II)|nr:MBL fold metallo-hydrolase [Saprospirales bacterium]